MQVKSGAAFLRACFGSLHRLKFFQQLFQRGNVFIVILSIFLLRCYLAKEKPAYLNGLRDVGLSQQTVPEEESRSAASSRASPE